MHPSSPATGDELLEEGRGLIKFMAIQKPCTFSSSHGNLTVQGCTPVRLCDLNSCRSCGEKERRAIDCDGVANSKHRSSLVVINQWRGMNHFEEIVVRHS